MSKKYTESDFTDLFEKTTRPVNGELKKVRERIDIFEARYEIKSERLIEKLKNGEQRETNEICNWLMDLELRASLEQK